MKARERDIVDVRVPSGVEQIEVLEMRYGMRHSTCFQRALKTGKEC
jgi:hypothetical protein